MPVNYFSAPNAKSLSDKMVQDVLQRTPAPRSGNNSHIHATRSSVPTDVSVIINKNDLPQTKLTFMATKFPSRVDPSLPAHTAGFSRSVKAITEKSNEIDLSNVAEAAEALIKHRRRTQQRKYRKQQRDYTAHLEQSVRKLQEEIKLLENQLQNASMGTSKSQSLWGVAAEYFRLFRHGIRSPSERIYLCVLSVLESSMAPNVRDGIICGPKAILTNWMLFSLCFDDINVDLERLERGPIENLVTATVNTSITISTGSLRVAFPHLIKEGEADGKVASLADKLLGQRLVVRGSVVFEWDDKIGRVTKMQSQSDMLTPMLQVFGNLEDVNRVFEGSTVSPDGCLFDAIC